MRKNCGWIRWTGECLCVCTSCGAEWLAALTLHLHSAPGRKPRRKAMCDKCIERRASPTLLQAYKDKNGGKL